MNINQKYKFLDYQKDVFPNFPICQKYRFHKMKIELGKKVGFLTTLRALRFNKTLKQCESMM